MNNSHWQHKSNQSRMSDTPDTTRKHRQSISLKSVDVSNLRQQFIRREEEARKSQIIFPKFQKRELKRETPLPDITSPRESHKNVPIIRNNSSIIGNNVNHVENSNLAREEKKEVIPPLSPIQKDGGGPAISFSDLRKRFLEIEKKGAPKKVEPFKKPIIVKPVKLDEELEKIKSIKKEQMEKIQADFEVFMKETEMLPEQERNVKIAELESVKNAQEEVVRKKADENRQKIQQQNEASQKQTKGWEKTAQQMKPNSGVSQRGKSIILIDDDEEGPPPLPPKKHVPEKKVVSEVKVKSVPVVTIDDEEMTRLHTEKMKMEQMEKERIIAEIRAEEQEQKRVKDLEQAKIEQEKKIEKQNALEIAKQELEAHVEKVDIVQEIVVDPHVHETEKVDIAELKAREDEIARKVDEDRELMVVAKQKEIDPQCQRDEKDRIAKVAEEQRVREQVARTNLDLEMDQKNREAELKEKEMIELNLEMKKQTKRLQEEETKKIVAPVEEIKKIDEIVPVKTEVVLEELKPDPKAEKDRVYQMQKERMKKEAEEKEKKRQQALLKQQEALVKKSGQEQPVVDHVKAAQEAEFKRNGQDRLDKLEIEAIQARKRQEEEEKARKLEEEKNRIETEKRRNSEAEKEKLKQDQVVQQVDPVSKAHAEPVVEKYTPEIANQNTTETIVSPVVEELSEKRKRLKTLISAMKSTQKTSAIHPLDASELQKTISLLMEKEIAIRQKMQAFDKKEYRAKLKTVKEVPVAVAIVKEPRVEKVKSSLKVGWLRYKDQDVFCVFRTRELMIYEKPYENSLGTINLRHCNITLSDGGGLEIVANSKKYQFQAKSRSEAAQWSFAIRSVQTFKNTHVVCKDDAKSFKTIGEALKAAEPYDRILVEAGIYNEQELVIDKPISIQGVGNVGLHAKEAIKVSAPVHLTNLLIKKVECEEYVCCVDCHIRDLTVIGDYHVINSKVHSLNAYGNGYLKDSVIQNVKSDSEIISDLSDIVEIDKSTGNVVEV